MAVRVWLSAILLAFLLAASPIAQVAGAQSEEDAAMAEVVENADLGYVGDDTPVSGDAPLSPAPGVETVCVFPKNAGKIVPAGEETELLVGLQNDGESTLNVVAVHSTLHLPYDHRMYGQNLTVQSFYNASVPVSVAKDRDIAMIRIVRSTNYRAKHFFRSQIHAFRRCHVFFLAEFLQCISSRVCASNLSLYICCEQVLAAWGI
ncbi:hypothetical protein ACQ4PT_055713 [Festuca glaucescens]